MCCKTTRNRWLFFLRERERERELVAHAYKSVFIARSFALSLSLSSLSSRSSLLFFLLMESNVRAIAVNFLRMCVKHSSLCWRKFFSFCRGFALIYSCRIAWRIVEFTVNFQWCHKSFELFKLFKSSIKAFYMII